MVHHAITHAGAAAAHAFLDGLADIIAYYQMEITNPGAGSLPEFHAHLKS